MLKDKIVKLLYVEVVLQTKWKIKRTSNFLGETSAEDNKKGKNGKGNIRWLIKSNWFLPYMGSHDGSRQGQ